MMDTITASVEEVMPLTNSILKLILKPESYVEYQAGQYLEILVGSQWQAYSIANAPLGARHYELHIRHVAGNPYEEPLFVQIKQEGKLCIRMPHGHCTLSVLQSNKPILFIAGGTGLAPVKAMIEQLLATDDRRPFDLWWAVRGKSDLYYDEQLQIWQNHVPHFHYFQYLADTQKKSMLEKVIQHYGDRLQEFQIVLAGPFIMVYATRDRLISAGVLRESMVSDAFDFEE